MKILKLNLFISFIFLFFFTHVESFGSSCEDGFNDKTTQVISSEKSQENQRQQEKREQEKKRKVDKNEETSGQITKIEQELMEYNVKIERKLEALSILDKQIQALWGEKGNEKGNEKELDILEEQRDTTKSDLHELEQSMQQILQTEEGKKDYDKLLEVKLEELKSKDKYYHVSPIGKTGFAIVRDGSTFLYGILDIFTGEVLVDALYSDIDRIEGLGEVIGNMKVRKMRRDKSGGNKTYTLVFIEEFAVTGKKDKITIGEDEFISLERTAREGLVIGTIEDSIGDDVAVLVDLKNKGEVRFRGGKGEYIGSIRKGAFKDWYKVTRVNSDHTKMEYWLDENGKIVNTRMQKLRKRLGF